jgi:hypothetical protein
MSSYPTMHIHPDSDLSANSLESQASHVSETPGPEPCSVDPELEKGASIPIVSLISYPIGRRRKTDIPG